MNTDTQLLRFYEVEKQECNLTKLCPLLKRRLHLNDSMQSCGTSHNQRKKGSKHVIC